MVSVDVGGSNLTVVPDMVEAEIFQFQQFLRDNKQSQASFDYRNLESNNHNVKINN